MMFMRHVARDQLISNLVTEMAQRKSPPKRAPGQVQMSISLPQRLRDAADKRAQSLGLSRSAYVSQLLRAEARHNSDLVLKSLPPEEGQAKPSGNGSKSR